MITAVLIAITCLISILSFNNRALYSLLALKPYEVLAKNQWYRTLSSAFVHADYTHLLVNMFVFYSFGTNVESIFHQLADRGLIHYPVLSYLGLYLLGAIVSSLFDIFKYRRNPNYTSIGASGAVAAVLFTSIFFNPWGKVYFFGILPIWGIVFGVIYILYCWWMGRNSRGNINHFAHLWGSLFGIIYPILLNSDLINIFIHSILSF